MQLRSMISAIVPECTRAMVSWSASNALDLRAFVDEVDGAGRPERSAAR